MAKKLTRMAIAYDFDGTLAPGNMQEHSFIPKLEIEISAFWAEVKENAKAQDMDEILSYMQLMLKKASEKNLPIRRSDIRNHGKDMAFFPGVGDWFSLINQYAEEQDVEVYHYIISSGLREMIKGTAIGKRLKFIFASGFSYDANKVAEWPALAVNYTNKTQYLFRINKGINNSYDNQEINKFTADEDRPIPFSNIIYIGDGETDIPCMKMLKYQGGTSIAVFNPAKRASKKRRAPKEIANQLVEHGRADFAVPANYIDGFPLSEIVKAIIVRTAASARLNSLKRAPSSRHDKASTTASQNANLSPGLGDAEPPTAQEADSDDLL